MIYFHKFNFCEISEVKPVLNMKKKIGKKVVPKLHQLCRNFEAASDKSLAISTFHVIGMVTGHQTNKQNFNL